MNTFMVDIDLPESPSNEFIELIPHQRKFVNKLMKSGVIQNYSVSNDRRKLWIIIIAISPKDARLHIESFPIIRYIKYEINKLLIHKVGASTVPQFWLN